MNLLISIIDFQVAEPMQNRISTMNPLDEADRLNGTEEMSNLIITNHTFAVCNAFPNKLSFEAAQAIVGAMEPRGSPTASPARRKRELHLAGLSPSSQPASPVPFRNASSSSASSSSPQPEAGMVITSLSLNREADGTWRTTNDKVHKENHKNHKLSKDDSPSSPTSCNDDSSPLTRSRQAKLLLASSLPAAAEAKQEQVMTAKKLQLLLEAKENKENESDNDNAAMLHKLHRPSPSCIRHSSHNSKCDLLNSPITEPKFGPIQSSVSIIIEKGMIY